MSNELSASPAPPAPDLPVMQPSPAFFAAAARPIGLSVSAQPRGAHDPSPCRPLPEGVPVFFSIPAQGGHPEAEVRRDGETGRRGDGETVDSGQARPCQHMSARSLLPADTQWGAMHSPLPTPPALPSLPHGRAARECAAQAGDGCKPPPPTSALACPLASYRSNRARRHASPRRSGLTPVAARARVI